MPKIIKEHIFAFDESAYTMERISISRETRKKFKEAGKVRRVLKPPRAKPPQTPYLSKEDLEEIQQETQERLSSLTLLARLTQEKKSLEDRLSDTPMPLIKPIKYQPHQYQIPPPIPNTLHFHQTKKLLRIKEFKNIIEPTLTRITPFFEKIGGDHLGPHATLQDKAIEDARLDPLWKWLRRLEDIVEDIDEVGHKFTAAEWRKLKGACKRVGKVSLQDLSTRLPEISNTLLSLDITLPGM